MPARPGFIRRFFLGLWRLLDFSRRLVLNVLFMIIVAVLLIAWFSSDRPPRLEPDTALVLNLQGDLVEEYRIGPREAALAEAFGEQRFETRLRDVLAALDHAARDPQITRAVLVLDEMGAAGQASLREVAAALQKFKASGKPVVAWGESFSQSQYYLAAHADEVYMHPGGMVTVHGLGGARLYYKNLLDKLGVHVNTFQAGRYKSFAEPFTRTGPTPEAREARLDVVQQFVVEYQLHPGRLRQRGAGEVVRGRAEASGNQQDIGLRGQRQQRVNNRRQVVVDGADLPD